MKTMIILGMLLLGSTAMAASAADDIYGCGPVALDAAVQLEAEETGQDIEALKALAEVEQEYFSETYAKGVYIVYIDSSEYVVEVQGYDSADEGNPSSCEVEEIYKNN